MKKIVICLLALLPLALPAQTWMNDAAEGGSYLQYMYYPNYLGYAKAPDSAVYIFSVHQPEKPWKKKSNDQEQGIISRIDQQGNISIFKKVPAYFPYGAIASFNGKFYVLSGELQSGLTITMYNSQWEVVTSFKLAGDSAAQPGEIGSFFIDPGENVYCYTNGTACCKQPGKPPAALYLFNRAGSMVKKLSYPQTTILDMQVDRSGVQLITTPDSSSQPSTDPGSRKNLIETIRLGPQLEEAGTTTLEMHRDINVHYARTLENGNRLFLYDSINLNGIAQTYSHWMMLVNGQGRVMWKKPQGNGMGYEYPAPLANGGFVLGLKKNNTSEMNAYNRDRLMDTVAYDMISLNGHTKTLKYLLQPSGAGTEPHRSPSFHLEGRDKEIWAFYWKSVDRNTSRLYFMKIPIQ